MTSEEPVKFDHKNIHEAVAAVYREVGYVQKQKTVGLKYSYAGEASLIEAIRPALVMHEIYMHVTDVRDVTREVFTTGQGTTMNRVSLTSTVRFTHGPSGTSIDVAAAGEGMDAGDKATPKAMTGAYKYALRETFCIETGDDPDGTPFDAQERSQARTGTPPAHAPNGGTNGSAPKRRPAWQAELLGALSEFEGMKMGDLKHVLEKDVTPETYADLVDGWLFDNPGSSVRVLVRAAHALKAAKEEPVGVAQ